MGRRSNRTDFEWSKFFDQQCTDPARLYCIEQ